jgi:hypothetical protein
LAQLGVWENNIKINTAVPFAFNYDGGGCSEQWHFLTTMMNLWVPQQQEIPFIS